MNTNATGGKFGIEIPALTEARARAAAENYSPESRENFQKAVEASMPFIERVWDFLEKAGAMRSSACGSSYTFGLITESDDVSAPCGVTFYGTPELAQKLATAFPTNRVMTTVEGTVIEPAIQLSVKAPNKPKISRGPRM